jgi:outer membrane immunogenic protein
LSDALQSCEFIGISLSLGVVPGASAADMPVKSRPYVEAQVFSWSGFYLGLHAGYGWGSNNWKSLGFIQDPTADSGLLKPKTDGVLGGIQLGANYQLASWVFGIEADMAFIHAKGSANGPLFSLGLPVPGPVATATSQIEWLALFTGRAGYAFDRTLFYVKGGVAAAGTKDNFTLSLATSAPPQFIDFGTRNNTQVGWTIGGGIEHAFAPNWSAKIEYNYVDLGTTSENFNGIGNLGTPITMRQDIEHKLQIVKVGANYRF